MNHQRLVESTDGTRDFNTIDLDKIIIDNSITNTTSNIKIEENQVKVLNSNSNDIEKGRSSMDSNTEMIKLEEQKVYNTLNEPVIETLKRDALSILYKVRFVLNPYINDEERVKHLRNWDLWGPLVLTILLSMALSISNEDKGTLFVEVFSIFWIGGAIVTFNAQVLGAKVSIFQILCLLGYCMFPLDITALMFKLLFDTHVLFKLMICLAACFWSCYSSTGFMKSLISEEKKYLVLYPVILFYLFFSFFVLMNHKVENSV